MGTFKVTVEIGDPQGTQYRPIEALVDTGATYTLMPATILESLGVRKEERWPFELADGRIVQRDIGRTMVRLDGKRVLTVVIFGEQQESPLLGAYTLEGVRLAADPVRQRLIEVPGLLK